MCIFLFKKKKKKRKKQKRKRHTEKLRSLYKLSVIVKYTLRRYVEKFLKEKYKYEFSQTTHKYFGSSEFFFFHITNISRCFCILPENVHSPIAEFTSANPFGCVAKLPAARLHGTLVHPFRVTHR